MKELSLRVFISLTSWALLSTFCAAGCYFPDNDVAVDGSGSGYTSCATSTSDVTSCCDTVNSGVCQSNGLCQAPSSYGKTLYRGACTDQSWKSPNCPDYCLTSVNFNKTFVWVIDCGSGSYCCSSSSSYNDQSCCSGTNHFTVTSASSVASATGTSTSRATPSATQASSRSSLSSSTIGGIVAGCVVGVALIVSGILYATMPSFRKLVHAWIKAQGGKHTGGEKTTDPPTGKKPVPTEPQSSGEPAKPLEYDQDV